VALKYCINVVDTQKITHGDGSQLIDK
jgi:hypothetical protein